MKTVLILAVLFSVALQSAEIVDVRIQIPMTNDAPRVKDYYLSTDGASLKKDLVIKVVRKVSISQGKKNIGDVNVEIGQLRIMAVSDKVAVAREYKLFPKEQAPLTESIGFMVGDQVDTANSFIDNTKRKPSGEESPAPVAEGQPIVTPEVHPGTHTDSEKIEVKIFPEKI